MSEWKLTDLRKDSVSTSTGMGNLEGKPDLGPVVLGSLLGYLKASSISTGGKLGYAAIAFKRIVYH